MRRWGTVSMLSVKQKNFIKLKNIKFSKVIILIIFYFEFFNKKSLKK